jgi:hypothetical protein
MSSTETILFDRISVSALLKGITYNLNPLSKGRNSSRQQAARQFDIAP